ncbi:MAG: NADH-quinone oxidoreductase subunit NuoB [Ignavibacteriae bacterium]|nr:NADH-quinone oxidoreductase subunit NuoB [Ignavibacteriota bacterium]
MFKILRQSIRTGVVTNSFPAVVTEPAEGFRGKPEIDFARCTGCDACADACPTDAITLAVVSHTERTLSLDLGHCIFCGECEAACPDGIRMTKEFQLATTDKSALLTRARYKLDEKGTFEVSGMISHTPSDNETLDEIGAKLKEKIRRLFGRSLHIREVDAGSCNGCEVEITALNNPIYDIERFGVHFVASPRHADMLVVTGPVTRNMELALRQTYEATPKPMLVVAVGACAIGGGVFGSSYASCGGVDTVVPVDVYIPGCPPRPEALLHGILVAVDRLPQRDTDQLRE